MKASLDDVYLFMLVVRHGGFSAAAQAAGLQRSRVSRRIQALEQSLGCELLVRTTRQISLTEQGARFFDEVNQPLMSIGQSIRAVRTSQKEFEGRLKIAITAPLIGFELFTKIIDEYSESHPGIAFDIVQRHESADLKQEGIDLQVQPDSLPVKDDGYIQQTFLDVRCSAYATEAYIEKYGLPKTLPDLYSHSLMVSRYVASLLPDDLPLKVCSDELRLIFSLAVQGMGIAILPDRLVSGTTGHTNLYKIALEKPMPSIRLTLVYPTREYMPERTRVMLSLINKHFKQVKI